MEFFIFRWFLPDKGAPVAELVDAQDLKSCLPKGKYGFDSRLGHSASSRSWRGVFISIINYFTREIPRKRRHLLESIPHIPVGDILVLYLLYLIRPGFSVAKKKKKNPQKISRYT